MGETGKASGNEIHSETRLDRAAETGSRDSARHALAKRGGVQ